MFALSLDLAKIDTWLKSPNGGSFPVDECSLKLVNTRSRVFASQVGKSTNRFNLNCLENLPTSSLLKSQTRIEPQFRKVDSMEES